MSNVHSTDSSAADIYIFVDRFGLIGASFVSGLAYLAFGSSRCSVVVLMSLTGSLFHGANLVSMFIH